MEHRNFSISVLLVSINSVVDSHFLYLEKLDLVLLVLSRQFFTNSFGKLNFIPWFQFLKNLFYCSFVILNELDLEICFLNFLFIFILYRHFPIIGVTWYAIWCFECQIVDFATFSRLDICVDRKFRGACARHSRLRGASGGTSATS